MSQLIVIAQSGRFQKMDSICQVCGKSFQTKNGLVFHTRKSHDNKTFFECRMCDLKFKYKHRLKYHMQIKHAAEKQICEFCDKEFYIMQALKNHIKLMHEGIKEHQCHRCGSRFKTNGEIKSHLLMFVSKKSDEFKAQHETAQTIAKEYKGQLLFVTIGMFLVSFKDFF